MARTLYGFSQCLHKTFAQRTAIPEQLILEGVRYLILSVAADVDKTDTLAMGSLVPNIHRCLDFCRLDYNNIFYDANSIMQSYQSSPTTVIQALQLITRFHPAHHCIYFSFKLGLLIIFAIFSGPCAE